MSTPTSRPPAQPRPEPNKPPANDVRTMIGTLSIRDFDVDPAKIAAALGLQVRP